MSGKESFLIYKSFYEPIKHLSDEQLGRLFRALFDFQLDGIDCNDTDIAMAFMFFKNQFRLDNEKYQKVVERNRNNGLKGGRPRNPVGLEEPKKADKEKDKEKENGKENDIIDSFESFFDEYHKITGLKKTDKADALKKWKKLTSAERDKAIHNISNYANSVSDKKYCKKARTYLNDKNFNDEFVESSLTVPQTKPQGRLLQ